MRFLPVLALCLVCAAPEGRAVTFEPFSTDDVSGSVAGGALPGSAGRYSWRITGGDGPFAAPESVATGVVAEADRAYRVRGTFSYLTEDFEGPSFDPFVFFTLPGVFLLIDPDGPQAQTGVFDFQAGRGTLFGFAIDSFDVFGGAATVDVDAQVVPIPLPASFGLLLGAFAGLAFLARRRSGFEHAA